MYIKMSHFFRKIFLLLIAPLIIFGKDLNTNTHHETDIIISRYKESLDYLNDDYFLNFRKIIIYNKGPTLQKEQLPLNSIIYELPNVGSEVHTYLHHILNYRKDLANFNIFLPASYPYASYKKFATQDLFENYKNYKGLFKGMLYAQPVKQIWKNFMITHYSFSNSFNHSALADNIPSSKIRPFQKWYQHYFPDNFYNICTFNGIFAVNKEYILKTDPLLIQEFLDHVSVSIQSESTHYLERSWAALFFPQESSLSIKSINSRYNKNLKPSQRYALIGFN